MFCSECTYRHGGVHVSRQLFRQSTLRTISVFADLDEDLDEDFGEDFGEDLDEDLDEDFDEDFDEDLDEDVR